MYPAVQVKYDYPVGAPKIHVFDSKFYPCRPHESPVKGNSVDLKCSCTLADRKKSKDKLLNIVEHRNQPTLEYLKNVFGFICVTCQPPKHLYHPVLVTWDEENSKCVATLDKIVEQVFTTEEFKYALEKGYKVIKVHRIDEYKRQPGLWNEFVKDLYIEKLANSGDAPPEDEQQKLVDSYEKAFGMGDAVKESFSRWKYDGAMRTVYKTLLNSGWGKHCQRPNMDQHLVYHADTLGPELFENVQAGNFEVKNIMMHTNGYATATFTAPGKRINTHNSYIAAGCYVPAYGRLTLLREMDRLGERVLYHDTDSIIYLHDPTKYNIPCSELWGDWDEEKISKKGIDAFVSLGPKSYSIKAQGEEVVKLKGISIKYAHRNMINFNVLSTCIDEHVRGEYIARNIPQMSFKYVVGEGICTRNFIKKLKFQPELLKGNLSENLQIFPRGYCRDCAIGNHCSQLALENQVNP